MAGDASSSFEMSFPWKAIPSKPWTPKRSKFCK